MQKLEAPGIESCPVLDERGNVLLYDLYVARRWVGSRRTAEQCAQYLTFLCDVEIESTPGSPW